MKVISKSEKIRRLLKEGKSTKEIMEIADTKAQNIYAIKHALKKHRQNKRRQRIATPDTLAGLRWVRKDLVKASDPKEKIAQLEHEIAGYKAVISYLEYQLGLTSTQ